MHPQYTVPTPYADHLSRAIDRCLVLEEHPDAAVRRWARAMRRAIETELEL